MNRRISITPVNIGRLSLGIIAVGLVYMFFIIKQDGYNGLDGTNTEERLFLLLISIGGIMGSIAYSKKKSTCSALAGIIFVVVMISAGSMYFNKPSNQILDPTWTTPVD
jgi:hypothetical protein